MGIAQRDGTRNQVRRVAAAQCRGRLSTVVSAVRPVDFNIHYHAGK